jgi:hypothetical protein
MGSFLERLHVESVPGLGRGPDAAGRGACVRHNIYWIRLHVDPIQRDAFCIANPTPNSALSTSVVRLRLRLRILNLNNNATPYGISNIVQYLQCTHRFKSETS